MRPDPEGLFRKEYGNGTNFMTPTVVRYGLLPGNYAYELSKGSGFDPGVYIYGVTVLKYDPVTFATERCHSLSKGGFNLSNAENYITALEEQD